MEFVCQNGGVGARAHVGAGRSVARCRSLSVLVLQSHWACMRQSRVARVALPRDLVGGKTLDTPGKAKVRRLSLWRFGLCVCVCVC